ncbi:NAD(P)-dependent oxidoreductase [uncultured Microbacterium sp.]|uniref:NAD-dependent epimerase/dehydratase family protein n=1 Tax=uncultured Microbacterium sp. TaxID=191216 RepID=UPI0025DA3CD2|nr:NAD(P)-dependent oxidoreductase [uncultured Microbacterium sp.]
MSETEQRRVVVVTGAGGYIGRHVVMALEASGFPVRALVRPGSRRDLGFTTAEVLEVDVLGDADGCDAVLGSDTLAVIHLAWQDGFVHNAPSHMALLSQHFRLLEQIVDAGVPHLSVLGTMHEIGYWEGAIAADTPTNPRSLYGIAKDALRRAAFVAFADRTNLTWLRCYYIYGDDRNNNSIFTRLLEAVDAGKETMPFTSGKNRYDFVDVDELGSQIAAVATTPGVAGVINCGSGVAESLGERVEAFIRDQALPIRLEYGAFPDRPYDSPAVWGDPSALTAALARRSH